MKIKQTLLEIARYLQSTRKVGHTRALLKGAEAQVCTVICSNHQYADELQTGRAINTIALDSLHNQLAGRKQPLMIDNGALQKLFFEAVEEMARLERLNANFLARLEILIEETQKQIDWSDRSLRNASADYCTAMFTEESSVDRAKRLRESMQAFTVQYSRRETSEKFMDLLQTAKKDLSPAV